MPAAGESDTHDGPRATLPGSDVVSRGGGSAGKTKEPSSRLGDRSLRVGKRADRLDGCPLAFTMAQVFLRLGRGVVVG